MTQKVICDGCGAQDDWSMGKEVFFPAGAQLFMRADNGSQDGGAMVDLCPSCLSTILEALPNLKEKRE